MASLIHKTLHGLVAGDAIYFGNLEPSDCGIEEGRVYYVLSSGLTVDDFEFSETDGGAAFDFLYDITNGIVSKTAVYTPITDPTDVMAPPVAPDAPGSCVLTSAAVLAPDGTVVTRLTITITQPTNATLRHTVVTVSGGSNTAKVVIPVGQTTGSIASVVPGVSYTGSAVAYDTFGLSSTATVSAAHVAAGDTTAPAQVTGLAAFGAILGLITTWDASASTDLANYEVQVDDNSGFTSPDTYKIKATVLALQQIAVGTYYFRVRAVDLSGNAGTYSSTVSATSRTVQTADLTDALITTAKLVAGSVTDVELATAAVTAAKIAVDAVTASAIQAGAVGTSEIDALAVTSAKLAALAVTTAKLDASAVTTAKIAADAVTAAEIATGAVGSTELAAGAVIAGKITAGTIVAADIAAGTITGAKIAAGTIEASNIAADTITANEIAANAVSTSELNALAVTTAKLAAGAVTAAKITAGTITATEIAALTIVAANIAANTITAAKIAAGTITATEIAALTIVAGNIAAGTITAAKIAAGTITTTEIATDTILAGNIAASAITSSELAAGAVIAGKITAGTIVAADIASDTITATQIAASAITSSELAANAVIAGKILAGTIATADLNATCSIQLVTNSGSTCVIDANGLTITNGKISVQDKYGTSSLDQYGFSGGWLKFLTNRVYNGDFGMSVVSTLAVTETGSGSGLANYIASLNTNIPYWVTSQADAGQTMSIITDTSASGKALKFAAGGTVNKIGRVYIDVPVSPGLKYNSGFVWKRTAAALHDLNLNTYASFRDSTHALIGSRLGGGLNYTTNQAAYTYQSDINATALGVAPANAAFLRFEIEVQQVTTASSDATFAALMIFPADVYADKFVADTSLAIGSAVITGSGTQIVFGTAGVSMGVGGVFSQGGTGRTDFTGHLRCQDGVTTIQNAGAVSDASFTIATPLNGAIAQDTTNHRQYYKRGGAWHYSAETAGFQVPSHERVCPAEGCGELLGVNDALIGKGDRAMEDGGLHALYVHLRCADQPLDRAIADTYWDMADAEVESSEGRSRRARAMTSIRRLGRAVKHTPKFGGTQRKGTDEA